MWEKIFKTIAFTFLFGTQTGRTSVQWTLAEARFIYRRLIGLSIGLAGMIILAWILAYFGATGASTIFALIIAPLALILAYRPINVAVVLVIDQARSILSQSTVDKQKERFLSNIQKGLFNALAWILTVFMALRFVPVEYLPTMFFPTVLSLVIFYKILCEGWEFGGNLGKRLIYLSTLILITIHVILAFPSSLQIKITGYDINSTLKPSALDDKKAEAAKVERKAREKQEATFLERINAKRIAVKPITPEEETRYNQIMRGNSWFGKLSSKASSTVGKIPWNKISWHRPEEPPAKTYPEESGKNKYTLRDGRYHYTPPAKLSFDDGHTWSSTIDLFVVNNGEANVLFSKEVIVKKLSDG